MTGNGRTCSRSDEGKVEAFAVALFFTAIPIVFLLLMAVVSWFFRLAGLSDEVFLPLHYFFVRFLKFMVVVDLLFGFLFLFPKWRGK